MLKRIVVVLLIIWVAGYFSDNLFAMCGMPGCTHKAEAAEHEHSKSEKGAKYFEKTIYQCSMHPQITSEKPGKCSICKMKLEPKKVYKTYACPTCDYHQGKPGKCPHDGKELKESDVQFFCPKCGAEINIDEVKTKPKK